jgi:D-lactate dehydrogenase
MKVVAYSVKPFEKEYLAKANQKKHDITLISNALSLETSIYAEGKEAVIVFTSDDVSAPVIKRLADMGIKYITTRSAGTDHIDTHEASKFNIKLSNVPSYSPQAVAEHAVALAFALNRHLIQADKRSRQFDFRNDELIGFNFSGKTVGIIGLGRTGMAVAHIYKGMGCNVTGYDPVPSAKVTAMELVTLDTLLTGSDIISLHIPLTPETDQLIDRKAINQMKDGVMLINTSRGALLNMVDILAALESGKVGYLGIDVYEYGKHFFFEDHENDKIKDHLLQKLMDHPNVIVTPHQAYLTREALQEIANQTVKNLDLWQADKCVGKACISNKDCSNNDNKFTSTSQSDGLRT